VNIDRAFVRRNLLFSSGADRGISGKGVRWLTELSTGFLKRSGTLIAIVSESETPFERRSLGWDPSALPPPAEVLIYTEQEWRNLIADGGRFARMIETETVWLLEPEEKRRAPEFDPPDVLMPS
jgi:hypothetical protein